MSNHTVVQFFPDDEEKLGHDCGYCHQTDTSISTGMWAHAMTVTDYQDLINRNWRRSGMYCYHPQMKRTCCPQYMIRCDAANFKITKGQKKIIKKFNRFVMTGSVKGEDEDCVPKPAASASGEGPVKMEQDEPKQIKKGDGADPTKPKALKAKQLRQLRKQEKREKSLQSDTSTMTAQPAAVSQPGDSKQKGNTDGKGLSDLLNEYDPTKAKHKFELRLVQSHPRSAEFEATVDEELAVYQKYQVAIHKDPISKVDMEQFERFLITSPLAHEKRNGVGLGSFHYQYLLDGKIIAVEIMDLLPEFISSKYFIYDPKYEFLTLGTYSTLRSIYFIQQIQQKLPSMKHYLMGYYIHACQKMRYKALFGPSYLLCPETYIWTPVEQCTPKLDQNKYSRFHADPNQDDIDKPEDNSYESTSVLHRRQALPYKVLCMIGEERDDSDEVKHYTRLVGKALSQSMLLYRP